MIEKRDVGRWVRIVFWDHVIIEQELPKRSKPKPILCEVAGMIRSVSARHITVATWWVHSNDSEVSDTNAETVVIVRSTIDKYAWTDVLKWWNE